MWRFDMRRLRAEEIRDSILAVNNTLNLDRMFGPSIYPVIEKEVLAGQSMPGAGWNQSTDEDRRRRSIYIHLKRSLTVPLLANFDVADTELHLSRPVRDDAADAGAQHAQQRVPAGGVAEARQLSQGDGRKGAAGPGPPGAPPGFPAASLQRRRSSEE